MTKAQRRKDVIAVVLIVGTAILYWTSGSRQDIELGDHRDSGSSQRPSVATDLPGLRQTDE
jgi:hypothetical protein